MTVENALDVSNPAPVGPTDVITEPTAAAPAEPVATAETKPEPAPGNNDADAAEDAKQKGIQKRIDRLTREKYEAKARADLLEQMLHQQPKQEPRQDGKQSDGRPTQAQYETAEDFVEALTDWKLGQREQASKAQAAQQAEQSARQKIDRLLADAESLGNFDREEFGENVRVTEPMRDAILDSDMGAKLIHHLHANPEESVRIANLSPMRQAAEIGKLEAKLSTPVAPKTSKAPPPISPIGSGNAAVDSLETDDMEAYISLRKKQGARWAR